MTDDANLVRANDEHRALERHPDWTGMEPVLDLNALMMEAVKTEGGIEKMERLAALVERSQDRAAAAEFYDARASFQAGCPVIPHDKTVKIVPNSGQPYSYTHASLAQIAMVVDPVLTSVGLSYSWNSQVDETMMTTTAYLRHRNGHVESASFSCPIDTAAKMTKAQQGASAVTYAKRQSLIQVLGITTADMDDDGRGPTGPPAATITDDQAATLVALCDEVKGDHAKFLVYMRAASFEEIRAADFDVGVKALEAKR